MGAAHIRQVKRQVLHPGGTLAVVAEIEGVGTEGSSIGVLHDVLVGRQRRAVLARVRPAVAVGVHPERIGGDP